MLNSSQSHTFVYSRSVVNPIGDNNEIIIIAENKNTKSGGKTTQT